MKRLVVVALALVAMLAFAAPAGAAPPGLGFSFPVTCDGVATEVTVTQGSAFWIGDQQYLLTSESATFTPAGGGEPETLSTNTFGNKTGLAGTEITCTAVFEEPEGVFMTEVTAVAVPPRS